jgi:hypothetical protein
MWTPEQSQKIQAIAREAVPGIRTMALPHGLQVQRGPDAVVEYLVEALPGLINSDPSKSTNSSEKSGSIFRQHMPDLSSPRFQIAKQQTPYEYFESFEKNHQPPWLYNLTKAWEQLLEDPYKGLTADGTYLAESHLRSNVPCGSWSLGVANTLQEPLFLTYSICRMKECPLERL